MFRSPSSTPEHRDSAPRTSDPVNNDITGTVRRMRPSGSSDIVAGTQKKPSCVEQNCAMLVTLDQFQLVQAAPSPPHVW